MADINTLTAAGLSQVSAKLYGQKKADNAAGYVEIIGDTTFTVGATGCDFTDLDAAFDYIDAALVYSGATISVTVKDGIYSHSAPLRATSYNFLPVYVSAENVYTKTVSSIQGASGSAGAWSLELNLDTVTNIAVNDWVLITAPTGGTKPTFLAGAHKVTAVDAVNSRITIESKHKNASAPSGAVSATATILKVILSFTGCDGIQVYNNVTMGAFQNVMFVGDSTATKIGISVQDGSRLFVGGKVGVSGFDYNVFALYGAEINGNGIIVSSDAVNFGFRASDSGIISLAAGAVSSGSGQIGVSADRGGQIYLPGLIATGCTQQGIYAESLGSIICGATGGISSGNNTRGVETKTRGYVNPAEITLSDNTQVDSRSNLYDYLEMRYSPSIATPNTTFINATRSAYIQLNGNYFQVVANTGATVEFDSPVQVRAKVGGNTKIHADTNGVGFNGTAPIAKPVLATGAGKTVDEVITVLQNYGLVSQS